MHRRIVLGLVATGSFAAPGCSTYLAASAGAVTTISEEVEPAGWVDAQAALGIANPEIDVAFGLSAVGSFGPTFLGGGSQDVYVVVREERDLRWVMSIGLVEMGGRNLETDENIVQVGGIVRVGPALLQRRMDGYRRDVMLPRLVVLGGGRSMGGDDPSWDRGFVTVGLELGYLTADAMDCKHC